MKLALELEKYLSGREAQVVESARKQVREQDKVMRLKLDALKEFQNTPRTRKSVEKVMHEVLCFHSLAFCCGLDKRCPIRNSVLQVLGMSHKDFEGYKQKCHDVLLAEKTCVNCLK